MKRGDKIIRQLMDASGVSLTELSKRMGYKSPSSVASFLSRGASSTDTFLRAIDAMGYDVVLKRRPSDSDVMSVEFSEQQQ